MLILCGGRSSRMGQDKARLRFEHQGQDWTLAQWMSKRWAPVCESLQWAGAEPGQGVEGQWVQDLPEYRGQGPVAGLLSGLNALQERRAEPWTLLLAVDMPRFEPAWASALRDGARGDEYAIGFEQSSPAALFGGLLHRSRAQPLVEEALKQGERSMRALQARLKLGLVSQPIGIGSESLGSAMNHPSDYLQWLHEQGFRDLSFSAPSA